MIRAAQARAARNRYKAMASVLDEQSRQRFAALEARALGRGGVSVMARMTGLARPTIYRGLSDIRDQCSAGPGRVRKSGGGRQKKASQDPTLLVDLNSLVEPLTRGDPMQPLLCRWQAQLQFHPRHRAGRRYHPRAAPQPITPPRRPQQPTPKSPPNPAPRPAPILLANPASDLHLLHIRRSASPSRLMPRS
jgi:hypothetical protein